MKISNAPSIFPYLPSSPPSPSLGILFTALGYVVGAAVFFMAARRRNRATEGMGWIAIWGLLGGAAGAKLTEWAVGHPELFLAQPLRAFHPAHGGRTILGGIVVGWLAVEVAKRRLGIRRSTGDLFALALPAGEAVGRIGCHFNGCCYGVRSEVAWAVFQHDAWRHPAQLYAAFTAAMIFGILFIVRNRLPHEGDLFRLYLLLIGASRFWLEFLRERNVKSSGLSVAQWACLGLAAYGGMRLIESYRLLRTATLREEAAHG